MAECPPPSDGRYKIYSYFKQSQGTIDCPDVESWKAEIAKLTKDKMIVNWSHYTSPLKTLGPLGNKARTLSLAFEGLQNKLSKSNGLNKNHGFFHKFLVFDLKSVVEDDASSCSVSIEKQRSGLMFQISKKHETVKGREEGFDRRSVKFHASSKGGGFEGALVNNLATIQRVLEAVETSALYDLLSSNCQNTVNDWQRVVVDESLSLKFRCPGGGEPMALNDEGILDVIDALYPDWKRGKVQKFPEATNPFAIDVPTPLAENDAAVQKDHDFLNNKQRVVDSLFELLRRFGPSMGGRKAFLSNLTKNRFANALDLTQQLERTFIQELSELWSATFELVLVLDAVGVIMFNFQDQDNEADIDDDVAEMFSLASKIEDVSQDDKRSFVVCLTLGDEWDRFSEVKKQGKGYVIHAAICDETLSVDDQLQEALQQVMEIIFRKAKLPEIGSCLPKSPPPTTIDVQDQVADHPLEIDIPTALTTSTGESPRLRQFAEKMSSISNVFPLQGYDEALSPETWFQDDRILAVIEGEGLYGAWKSGQYLKAFELLASLGVFISSRYLNRSQTQRDNLDFHSKKMRVAESLFP